MAGVLLARVPAFADEVLGKSTRFSNNRTSNGDHLLDPSKFQLAQASSGAGNQKTSSAPAEPSMAEIANKANNPLSDVWLLLMQNDTTLFGGDLVKGTKVLNSFKIQPVMPFPIFDRKWNLIFRPIINIVSVPLDKDVGKLFGASGSQLATDPGLRAIAGDPFGRTSGLGDSVLLTLLGPLVIAFA